MLTSLNRTDPNDSLEAWLTDTTTGVAVEQSAFHRLIQQHISDCWQRGSRAGILTGMGWGKSQQVLGRVGFEVGNNPNEQVQIVCNTDDNAKARVATLKTWWESPGPYRETFPEVEPDREAGWTKHELFLKRQVVSIAPTVAAYGVGTGGTGSRSTLSVYDDLVDYDNAIGSPASRDAVKGRYYQKWSTRLVETGRSVFIGTPYNQDDLVHELIGKDTFDWLTISTDLDMDGLAVRRGMDARDFVLQLRKPEPERRLPFLPYFGRSRLEHMLTELGPRLFMACYGMQASSDSDKVFPNFGKALVAGQGKSWSAVVDREWPRYTGVDPSSESRPGTAIFTIAVAPNGLRIPIDLRLGDWGFVEFVEQLCDVWRTCWPRYTAVEDNALQGQLINALRAHLARSDVTQQYPAHVRQAWGSIVPFTTGPQKHSREVGLPALDIQFANGLWLVPGAEIGAHAEASTTGECPWQRWVTDMQTYPLHRGQFDLGMACWFAASLADKYGGGSVVFDENDPYQKEETPW